MRGPHPHAAHDRPSIVLVYDDPNSGALLTQALDEEGFAVAQVGSLTDAASRARECAPDLIILAHLRKPLDDAALVRLRSDPTLRDVPLVVVRGRNVWRNQDLDTFLAHVWRTINAQVLGRP